MDNSKSSGKSTRTRNWMMIVYPDSAPENWRDQIDQLHIEWCCGPLHDQDINADGTPKKPHWHVILAFGSVQTYEQVKEITDSLGQPIPERVKTLRGAVRYLAHMDNPDKAQYSKDDIATYGGMDVSDMLRSSDQDRRNVVKDMCRWVTDNGVTEFWMLMQYAMDNEPDWWEALISNSAYIMDLYIKSWRNGGKRGGSGNE